jgi:uncharacterized membrane protein
LKRAPTERSALEEDLRARLARHRRRILPFRVLAARPRFVIAVAVGMAVGFLTPDALATVSRALLGWNAAIVCYLATVVASTRNSSHHRIRLQAQMLDDGRFFVLILCALAAVAAIGAIVAELGAAKDLKGLDRAGRLVLAAGTIVTSWLFIHMVFALHYAHEYYLERRLSGAEGGEQSAEEFDIDGDGDVDEEDVAAAAEIVADPRGGLIFPGTKQPGYIDFIYFSYIIGVASQTADVSISSRPMRVVSLAHSILSFFFNTTILALTINLVAGLF